MRANKTIWTFILACLLALAMPASLLHASEHTLKGKHQELGLACKDCHGTDTPERRVRRESRCCPVGGRPTRELVRSAR